MDPQGKVVVVTGAASGIGAALCRALHRAGAAAIVAADIDTDGCRAVAEAVGGTAMTCDVRREQDVAALVAETETRYGRLDLFCSNAGIFVRDTDGVASASNADWQRIWEINVMAHVYAARAALPGMQARSGGAFLITASAAGLLSQIGSAPYAVTKAAAVAFAESLAIEHGDAGIEVSVLCPQAVATPMVTALGGPGVAGLDGMATPEQVADAALEGLRDGRFLILPHPEVAEYAARKGADRERWLGGMRRLRRSMQTPPQETP